MVCTSVDHSETDLLNPNPSSEKNAHIVIKQKDSFSSISLRLLHMLPLLTCHRSYWLTILQHWRSTIELCPCCSWHAICPIGFQWKPFLNCLLVLDVLPAWSLNGRIQLTKKINKKVPNNLPHLFWSALSSKEFIRAFGQSLLTCCPYYDPICNYAMYGASCYVPREHMLLPSINKHRAA